MTLNYSGDPANVTTPLTATITNCADNGAGLVRVTTSSSHLFSTFDWVTIAGVVGCTEANTGVAITVISSTTFDLVGVSFVNPYTSGGTATDHSLSPWGTFAEDGEPGTVASMEAFMQLLADRTQWLANPAFGQSITRVCATTPQADPANWIAAPLAFNWFSLIKAKLLFVPVQIPDGAVWTGASVTVAGPSADVLAPGTPITIAMYRVPLATGIAVATSGFPATYADPVGLPGYISPHNFGVTGGTEVVNNTTSRYVIAVVSESGVNSNTGCFFYAASVTFTARTPDHGAA